MDEHAALVQPVTDFVAAVSGDLRKLTANLPDTPSSEKLREDAATEAADLAAAFIDADAIHSDDELWAWAHAFAGLLSFAPASPADLRASGLIGGKRSLLIRPSDLFELLVDADKRDGGRRAWTYYRHAMEIAHTVASLDVHTSQAELDAIARYRTVLIDRIHGTGLSKPEDGFFTTPRAATAQPEGQHADEHVDLPPMKSVEELMAELDELVGLEPVKAEVRLVTNLLIVQNLRQERGLPVATTSRHLVFTGNPGTGKTTVARLLAQIYRTLGVVKKGHLVETDRSGLVAGFVGQTATKTRDVCEKALDGLLLVDEAYSLARGSEQDFGLEAIDMLVKFMEDHRDRFVLVVAGYPDEMATFLGSNPGLASRFPKTIHFSDYSDDELVSIFEIIASKQHYDCDDSARQAVRNHFEPLERDRDFGNAREARNLFEASIARQATRLVDAGKPTDEQLVTLTADDIAG